MRAGLRLVAQRLHLLAEPEEVEAGVEDAGHAAHRRARELAQAAHVLRLGAPDELGVAVEPRDHLGGRAGDVARVAAVDGRLHAAAALVQCGAGLPPVGTVGDAPAAGRARRPLRTAPSASEATPSRSASSRARSVTIAPAGSRSAAPRGVGVAARRPTVTTRPASMAAGAAARRARARRRRAGAAPPSPRARRAPRRRARRCARQLVGRRQRPPASARGIEPTLEDLARPRRAARRGPR